MKRRWSGEWGKPAPERSPVLDVLIPTYGRPAELAVTLSGLAAQDSPNFQVIISDQTATRPDWEHPAAAAMIRVLRAQGRPVRLEQHLPQRGMAEQRQFLLDVSESSLVLYLDNDVWLEPDMLRRLCVAIHEEQCGFVGAAVQGLSYLEDDRPWERRMLELWNGPVLPERIRENTSGHARWPLHNAANMVHAAAGLEVERGAWLLYKVAWVGGCVMFDRAALVACGGFGFWTDLPAVHSGEDVTAQWRVMERYGGAGLLPSGAVHLESPTTVTNRSVDAAETVLGP